MGTLKAIGGGILEQGEYAERSSSPTPNPRARINTETLVRRSVQRMVRCPVYFNPFPAIKPNITRNPALPNSQQLTGTAFCASVGEDDAKGKQAPAKSNNPVNIATVKKTTPKAGPISIGL